MTPNVRPGWDEIGPIELTDTEESTPMLGPMA